MQILEYLILVDEQDEPIGVEEKMKAHEQGLLHRAFSVFLFSSDGKWLLQQRANNKYHTAGLWSNACCSHPQPGETIEEAAKRRIQEELGIEAAVEKLFHFIYRADLNNGLQEHELDHVLVGIYDGPVPFNPQEVADIKYWDKDELLLAVREMPDNFTPWFKLALPRVMDWK